VRERRPPIQWREAAAEHLTARLRGRRAQENTCYGWNEEQRTAGIAANSKVVPWCGNERLALTAISRLQ